MKNVLNVEPRGDREVVISREFDAPRELVWETMCDPKHLRRWLFGPPGWTMTACEDERKVGGKFRYAWSNEDGRAMQMTGTIREYAPPERCVRTETFDFGCVDQAGEQVATLVLVEKGNKTGLTITVAFPSKEARDGMIASGMEKGMAIGYERLDAILAEAR